MAQGIFKGLAVFTLIATGCTPEPQVRGSSRLKGLAAVDRAHNIAVIGSGAGPGVSSSNAFELDIKKMGEVLSGPPFNFEVRMRGDAYPAALAQEIAKAAQDLGPDGTLLFFFSGHGSAGNIYKAHEPLSVTELNDAAANGNYARFTAIIEACESGSFARGSRALQLRPNFKSLLVMTAAKASENSADNGTDSYFPNYLEKYLVELAKIPTATVGDLTQKVFQAAKMANPGQSGDMNAIPESILQEPVFKADGGTSDGIFVALGPTSSVKDPQTVFASIPATQGVTLALCAGSGAECQTLGKADSRLIAMDFASQSGNRMIYRSRNGVRLDQQPSQTVLVYSGVTAEKPSKQKTIKFNVKSSTQP